MSEDWQCWGDDSLKERGRRAARHSERLAQGGETQAEQELFDQIGNKLRQKRWDHDLTLGQVASSVGLDPAGLNFLEDGRVTKDELMEAIDRWTCALNLDAEEYRSLDSWLSRLK